MADETLKIPDELAEALKNHKVIPFIGAGLSRAVEKKGKDTLKGFNPLFPSWGELIERLASALKTKEKHDDAEYILGCLKPTPKKYLEAMQHGKSALKDKNWYSFLDKELNLDKALADESTLEATGNVWNLGSNLLITTNIDKVLQWNCPNSNPPRILDAQTIEYGQLEKEHFPQNPTVWHLHGYIDNKEKIIFTEEQYKSFYDFNSNEAKLKTLLNFLTQHTFLFIGFSLDDPYFLEQIKYLQKVYGKSVGDYYVLFKKGTIVSEEIKELVEIVEYEDYGQPFLDKLKQLSDIAKEGDDSKTKEEPKIEKEEPTKTHETEKKVFFNLPYNSKGKEFVGRVGKVEEIWNLLNQDGCAAIGQAVSVKGFGGLGKTQLAVEYAHAYRDKYKNGVFWLVADQNIDNQLLQIAEAQNWINKDDKSVNQFDVAKARFLNLSDCLILFDNVETYDNIKDYLPRTDTRTHLLITSREKLDQFKPIDLDLLERGESRELLLKISKRDPQDESEKEHLEKILDILGDIPLAVELVGGYLTEHEIISFAQYHQYLDEVPLDRLEKEFPEGSFTKHDRSIIQTLRISEKIIKEKPLMVEILKVLAWSGSSAMGVSLLKTLVENADESNKAEKEFNFNNALAEAHKLRLLKKDEKEEGYAIHRLLAKVIRHEKPLTEEKDWHKKIVDNLEKWIVPKIGDFNKLLEFEAELEHLREWQKQTVEYLPAESILITAFRANHSHERGNYKKANQWLEQALNLYQSNIIDNPKILGDLFNYLGVNNNLLGNYQKAKDFHLKALKIREELFGEKHPDTAMSYSNIGATYGNLGDHKKALEYNEKALELRKELFGEKHPNTANSYNNVGSTYGDLGDYKKALEYNEKALELRKELFGEKHPDTANSYNNVGLTYGNLGDHKKALEYNEKALELRKELFGEKHPNTAMSYNNIGLTYGDLGDHKKALEYKEKALELQKELFGEKHPDTAMSYNNVGATYGDLGDHKKALEYNEKALELQKELFGEKHPDTAMSYNNVGATYGNLGDHKKALEYNEKALELRKELFGEKHPDTANSYNNVGATYGNLGDHKKALEYNEKALKIYEELLGKQHPNSVFIAKNVIITYQILGNKEKIVQKSVEVFKYCPQNHPDWKFFEELSRPYRKKKDRHNKKRK